MKRPSLVLISTIVFILFLSLVPAKSPVYSKELPDLKCAVRCHTGNNSHNIGTKFHSAECRQCHNSGDSASHTIALNNIKEVTSSKGTSQKVSETMVLIPAGKFIMGSNDRWDDESPEFLAKTNSFLIDIHEVTNAMYKLFVDDTSYNPPPSWDGNQIPNGLENHPVVYVNWNEASAYCNWSGKRLPTETEWEKAARGELGYTFPWGNAFDPSKSNSPESGSKGTKPVKSYESGKSPYGLYDMAGNAWEWTSNWYLPHPGNNKPSKKYGKTNRVIKGGSWFDCLAYGCGVSAPSYNRGSVLPSTRNNTIGFRCVKETTEDGRERSEDKKIKKL